MNLIVNFISSHVTSWNTPRHDGQFNSNQLHSENRSPPHHPKPNPHPPHATRQCNYIIFLQLNLKINFLPAELHRTNPLNILIRIFRVTPFSVNFIFCNKCCRNFNPEIIRRLLPSSAADRFCVLRLLFADDWFQSRATEKRKIARLAFESFANELIELFENLWICGKMFFDFGCAALDVISLTQIA